MTWISENAKAVTITAVLAVLCFIALRGCGPGEVSPRTYEFTKSLVQLLQRRDDPRLLKTREQSLNDVRDQIAAAKATGDVSASESDLLCDIIDTALQGDEASAKQSLRDIMNAQVDR